MTLPPDHIRQIENSGCQTMVGFCTEMDQRDGSCRVTLDLKPQHLNPIGVLHGGIVAMLLDVVCGNTASAYFDRAEHPFVVTVSLNTSYVAAARAGRVTATAQAKGGGRSIAYVNGELHGEDGLLLATATAIFKRIRS
ncbi:PaaI family thioesterase [Parasedimentitalea psychrophila]